MLILKYFQDDDSEENVQSTFSEVTEKLTSPQQNDVDERVDKYERAESTDSLLESSPSVSVYSSPVYKPHTENSSGNTHSTSNDDATLSSPSGNCRNVKQRESKGKGKESKGNICVIEIPCYILFYHSVLQIYIAKWHRKQSYVGRTCFIKLEFY